MAVDEPGTAGNTVFKVEKIDKNITGDVNVSSLGISCVLV